MNAQIKQQLINEVKKLRDGGQKALAGRIESAMMKQELGQVAVKFSVPDEWTNDTIMNFQDFCGKNFLTDFSAKNCSRFYLITKG